MAEIHFRPTKIFDRAVFVYDSEDEDAPWLSNLQPRNPGDTSWVSSSNGPSYAAFSNWQASEFLKSAAKCVLGKKCVAVQPSSNVPCRSVIVDLVATADGILYTKLHEFVKQKNEEAEKAIDDAQTKMKEADNDARKKEAKKAEDEANEKKMKFQELKNIWNRTKRKIDVFSDDLFTGRLAEHISEDKLTVIAKRLGRHPEPPWTKQTWITTLKRLRNRFIHRSPYFLEKDFRDMKDCLPKDGENSDDDQEVFTGFIGVVATEIYNLSNLPLQ